MEISARHPLSASKDYVSLARHQRGCHDGTSRRIVPEITFLACNEQRVFERNSCHRELNCSLRSKACRSIRSARRRRQNDLLAATRRVFRFVSFRFVTDVTRNVQRVAKLFAQSTA